MKIAIIWFNLNVYSLLQILLFLTGAVFWIVNYVFVIRNIVKNKFVEMPASVLCANITWEFLWGFVFIPDMGFAIALGYKVWFMLDVFIVINFYKYGYKQVNDSIVPYYKALFTFALITWLALIYCFVKQGFDNAIGANSAYIINILISLLYITMFLRLANKSVLSFTTAWTKWLGTGLISVMCILKWPENYLLICMCGICFLLDMFYIYLILQNRKENNLK